MLMHLCKPVSILQAQIHLMRNLSSLLVIAVLISVTSSAQVLSSRMNEVFERTNLIGANVLQGPWEVTYGPDDSLWLTESSPLTGYKVKKIHPVNGGYRTILDLVSFTDPASADPDQWKKNFTPGNYVSGSSGPKVPSYQGGLMGMAIHPDFATNPSKRFIYLAYGHHYIAPSSTSGSDPKVTTLYNGETIYGHLFMTWLVRFTYQNGQLVSPVAICDTIRGSNDHNSGRLIIRPEDGTDYLYYAVGDLGAGQFDNLKRYNKAQLLNSYEGKILRFNLEEDADATQGAVNYNRWIPNSNPYNGTLGVQSAVWASGMRNNQGFAFNSINGVGRMYGSSHGPFSDDELNLLEKDKNYGHPLVIGYSADGNYNNAKAGPSSSVLPFIVSESDNAAAIPNYRDPIFSNYPAPAGSTSVPFSIQYIYTNQSYVGSPRNGTAQNVNEHWFSEGYSGLGLYSPSLIPGWKNSLLVAALKWGRVVRMKLSNDGSSIISTDGADTVSYFQSTNRFRDMAVSPDGKVIYVVMEKDATSSGPSANNPMIPSCAGCLQRYEFLGYNSDGGRASLIPTSITIAAGRAGLCETANNIQINSKNNNIWVPVTDTNSNVIYEINANGNNLGIVNTTMYKNGNAVRQDLHKRLYLDRNLSITTENLATSAVSIRFYITTPELNSLRTAVNSVGMPSGVNTIGDLGIFRSAEACSNSIQGAATPVVTGSRVGFGSNGFVLTATMNINAATSRTSSFYFSNDDNMVLALHNEDTTVKPAPAPGQLNVAPNPVTDLASVTAVSHKDGRAMWKLVDNAGRTVLTGEENLSKGANKFQINLKKLASGLYILHMSGTGIEQQLKIRKL